MTGVVMLAALGAVLLLTGLPSWIVLVGVALAFGAGGALLGVFPYDLLTAMPARIQGLLENDLIQALPLYVFMGALLNHLPLAGTLFRVLSRVLRPTGAAAPLAGLALAALLAPMNGSVGASALMLGRTVQPRLDESGAPRERGAALVCVASTLGVVIPPSLVLILLGDAMMRAHTEAVNVTHAAMRIVNTQDVFVGALGPAGLLFALTALVAWWRGRGTRGVAAGNPPPREWILALATLCVIVALLAGVTLGYLFAVEAAAAGGVALTIFGVATRTLTRRVLMAVLRDTMAISGALFALLLAATVFTLVLRAFGTDRWLAALLAALPGGAPFALAVGLAIVAACALVLDAFEMIFVVVPVVMPPLLTVVSDATWVSVLTLLMLAASFLLPPFGYAILLTRQVQARPLALGPLVRELAPYLVVQWLVLAVVLAAPQIVWHKNPLELPAAAPAGESAGPGMLVVPPPDEDAPGPERP